MSRTPTEIAREGLQAWRAGDFETIERILDPNVEWGSFEPGEWDCHSPDETATVMTFRGERVIAMRDYRTEAQALAAAGQA